MDGWLVFLCMYNNHWTCVGCEKYMYTCKGYCNNMCMYFILTHNQNANWRQFIVYENGTHNSMSMCMWKHLFSHPQVFPLSCFVFVCPCPCMDCWHAVFCVHSECLQMTASERALNCVKQDSAPYKCTNYYWYVLDHSVLLLHSVTSKNTYLEMQCLHDGFLFTD